MVNVPFFLLLIIFTIFTSNKSYCLSLVEAYEAALRNDTVIKIAEAEYFAGKETVNISRSALLPQVNLRGSYQQRDTKTKEVFLSTESSSLNENDERAKSLGLSIRQPLYDSSLWLNFQQGRFETKRAEHQLKSDRQALLLRVISAYIAVLRAQDNLQLSVKQEESDKRQLSDSKKRTIKNIRDQIEIYQATASYDGSIAIRLDNENSLGRAEDDLGFIIGGQKMQLWGLDESFPVKQLTPNNPYGWVEIASIHSPTIKIAKARERAAKAAFGSAKSEYNPTLYLEISHSEKRSNVNSIRDSILSDLDSEEGGASISINASIPLYSGGFIRSQVRQKKHQYRASSHNYAAVVQDTKRRISTLHRNITSSIDRVEIFKKSTASTLQALNALQEGYEKGLSDIKDVLDARRNYYRALGNFKNARYEYILNIIELKSISGSLGRLDLYELNHYLVDPK